MQGEFTIRDGALLLTVLLGLASVVGLSRLMEWNRPSTNESIEQEKLYVTANTVKRASLGFNGLVADWYWMRSLQYVGGKMVKSKSSLVDNIGELNLKLLPPLLDAATTLDPQFMEPYQYAAVVLPDIDVQEAIRIIKKGIAANPSQWRLYHNLGYIHWQKRDFKSAGEAYQQGAQISGAPEWMTAMAARMSSEGGSRNTARAIYQRLYEEAADDRVRTMASKHLQRLQALDQQDGLRRLLATYKSRTGRCPTSWRNVEPFLRALKMPVDASGAPIDPTGVPYLLAHDTCDVSFGETSEVRFW